MRLSQKGGAMSTDQYDALKLDNQLCFPLYACSREVIKKYTPLLDKLDLTYTQYITMMLLWEHQTMTVKELGKKLYLDSGTLTPLLKKLEAKGYLTRQRSKKDERNLIITITKEGMNLRDKAIDVPQRLSSCVNLSHEEGVELYRLLYKLLNNNQ